MRKIALGPNRVQGIDVSDWQSPLDWKAVKSFGLEFVFIKASEGITFQTKRSKIHASGAAAAGLLVGAYHFYRFGKDPIAQAKNFLSCIPKECTLPPVLDVEWSDGKRSLTDLDAKNILSALEHIEMETKRTPIIYTAASFFFGMKDPSVFLRFIPWIAHYTSGSVNVPEPWDKLVFWQNTDKLKIPGYKGGPIDGNYFNGTMAELKKLSRTNKTR